MGRDWTPREHLAAEQYNIEQGIGSIWRFLESAVINSNGKTERLYPDDELAIRKQFPLLGKLLSKGFIELYDSLLNINGGIKLLHSKDDMLAAYINSGKGDKDSALIKWFNGELDPCFHYGERNHQLLVNAILEEAKELSGMQKRLYQDYKQRWYSSHGVEREEIDAFKKEYAEDVDAGRFDGSFESYELSFGYHGGQVYACFEEFLDNEYQQLLKLFHSFSPGDYVNITVSDVCTGLGKVLGVTNTTLRVEMVEGQYCMCYPDSRLAENPMDVEFDLILEIERTEPEKYQYPSSPRSIAEIISEAVGRSNNSLSSEKGNKIEIYEEQLW